MLRAVWIISFLLAFCIENGAVWADSEPAPAATPVPDNREASFLPPPVELLPLTATNKVETPVATPKDKPPVAPKAEVPAKAAAKSIPELPKVDKAPVGEAKAAAQASSEALITPPPFEPVPKEPAVKPAPPAPVPVKQPSVVVVEPPKPAVAAPAIETHDMPASPAPVASVPAPVIVQAPPVPQVPALAVSAGALTTAEQKVVDAPLADVDPETFGLLSPTNGGLGASLWLNTSRSFVDRLMPSVGLPTSSATLNELARRLFLSTAAAPVPSATGEKPVRSLVAERVEALMALGAVQEAWKLATLSGPGLVDPVTLRLLAEAALIGPDGKEVCDKMPSLIAIHAKTEESGAEWQKSLLICQLRSKDMKAVQLGIDLMREQHSNDAVFLSLISKNVLAESKILPRQLTPLRPTTLAVLRQIELPLPSELYSRPKASLIFELLQAKAADEKARLGLAERAGAQGILTPTQLADIYKSVVLVPEEIVKLNASNDTSIHARAVAYQAALNEKSPQKKIELVQKFMAGVEPSVLTGAQGKLVADILETVPVISDHNAFSVILARSFAMAGRPDKSLVWMNLARDTASRNPEIAAALTDNWPLFVLLGIIPDGDYSQGMKVWMARAVSDGKDAKEMQLKREKAANVMLLLSAAGYAVPDEAWQLVMEVTPPSKQMMASPLVLERLRQASSAARKGETVLLSLLLAGGSTIEPSLAALTEIVKSLRQVGLSGEAQALAREVLIALNGG